MLALTHDNNNSLKLLDRFAHTTHTTLDKQQQHTTTTNTNAQRVAWPKKFPEADALALDLLDRMLQFDPRKRIDVHAALRHPWLAQLHDEASEPGAPGACPFALVCVCGRVRGGRWPAAVVWCLLVWRRGGVCSSIVLF